MKTITAHIDCNNFYASCERVFNPQLKNIPIVILSNNDGVIVARSEEAKALGIKMAAPYFKVKDIIQKNDVKVFSSNYTLYGDMSSRVMNIISGFTPQIEYYSIDEAFISLSHVPEYELLEYARKIRIAVLKNTGIPVSIGIAQTKTLSKIASKFAKKNPQLNNIFDMYNRLDVDTLLFKVPVYDIWGIGSQYGKFLMKHDLFTALDLKNVPDDWARAKLTVMGLRTVLELRNKPCIAFEEVIEPRKGIMSSRSFSRYVTELDELQEAVSQYTTRAAEKLRLQFSLASNILVFIQTNIHKLHEKQYAREISYSLPEPTAFTPELIMYARALMKRIYKSGFNYIKAGVMLTGIVPMDIIQLNMFKSYNHDKQSRLMKCVDRINSYWGRDTVKSASAGIEQQWQMRRDFCSPRYTTNWNELLRIKI